jgi:hypothetical protein
VISSFIAVYAFGFTLNFMTMMALSLCIGLLIDDAIVVRENIVRHVGMGKDHHTAASDGTNEIGLAVMATTFAIVRGVRAGGLHGRHHRQVLLPVRHHRGGGGAGEPVRQLHARPHAQRRLARPAFDALKKMPVIGHAIRATDRGMDLLHGLYERVIHWIFSERRWRVWLPAYAHGFDAARHRDKTSPRHWRLATITPRGVVMGIGTLQLRGGAGPGAAGGQRVRATDRPGLHAAGAAHAGGQQPGAHRRQGAADRSHHQHLPEVENVATWVGGAGPAQPGLAEHRAQAAQGPQRSQKQVEDAMREMARIPGTDASVGFNRPIYVAILGSDPEGLAGWRRLCREGQEDPRRGGRGIVSVKPGLPAYAVRLKPGAVRELGLTARNWPAACAPMSTARPPPTGPRPTATRSTWCCA